MQFPPSVERWRSEVQKYFPPHLVDKALWVIQHESGGNPSIRGDNGVAIGLFQIQDNRNFSNRPDATFLSNPINNIKYAANQLGGASGNFSAWGEGSTYKGQKFGALGNHPFPGETKVSSALNARKMENGDVKPKPPINIWEGIRTTGFSPLDKESPSFLTRGVVGMGKDFINKTGRFALSPPNPAGIASAIAGDGDYETQYWNILQRYLQLVDEMNELDPESLEDLEKLQILEPQLKALERSLLALEKGREAGLFTTGKDAIETFIDSEEGKQGLAADAYADYQRRVGDMVSLGKLGSEAFDTVSSEIDNSADRNAARWQGIENYELPRTTPVSLSRSGPGMDMSSYINAIRNTIPATAPMPYLPDPSMYDAVMTEVNKRRQSRGTAVPGPTSMPYNSPNYNPQTPFGV